MIMSNALYSFTFLHQHRLLAGVVGVDTFMIDSCPMHDRIMGYL